MQLLKCNHLQRENISPQRWKAFLKEKGANRSRQSAKGIYETETLQSAGTSREPTRNAAGAQNPDFMKQNQPMAVKTPCGLISFTSPI